MKAISGALLTGSAHVYAASFYCRKAMLGPETFICRHEAISKLDKELSSAYQAQMKNLPRNASICSNCLATVMAGVLAPGLQRIGGDHST